MLGLYKETGKEIGNYCIILDEEETLGTPGFGQVENVNNPCANC